MEAMMVNYGKGVVESTLGKLGSFLLSEALLVGSVRDDIVFIRDELQSMDAVVSDMIRAGSLSHQNKVWMLHVLQVAYEAERCIEKFDGCLKYSRDSQGLAKAAERAGNFLRTARPRYSIAKKIQNLKVQAMEVSQRHSRYNVTISTKETDITESARKAAIIARQDEYVQLSSRLTPEDALMASKCFDDLLKKMKEKSINVIVISGEAGFGKTALAKMAYRMRNDPNYGFEKSAWVTLSKNPDIDKILVDILRQVAPSRKGTEHYKQDKLTSVFTEELKNGSCLIILDSVWTEEDWGPIRNALPKNQEGVSMETTSKIIVTTRQEDVVNACRSEKATEIIEQKKYFTSADRNSLCSLILLNILSTWWDRKLINPIMDYFEEKDPGKKEPIKPFLIVRLLENKWYAALLLISLVMLAMCLVVYCIFHPIKVIIVIGIVMGLKKILQASTIAMMVAALVIIKIVTNIISNIFIWLCKQIEKLLQQGRYFHLTSWRNAPSNRVEPYVRLMTRERHALVHVPLALRFICGALIAKSMDSHRTNELFHDLQNTDANENDQEAQGTPQPPKHEIKKITLAKQSAQEKSEKEKLMDVIKCCYKILEHNPTLKKCAEDLNVLPEGYVINRKRLTRRWINLNFVSSTPGLSIEQVAESHFDELVIRGFIDVESINSCGNVKSCRVNSVFKEYLTDTLKYGHQISPHGESSSFQLYGVQPFSATPELSSNIGASFPVWKGWKHLKKKMFSRKNSQEPLTLLDMEICEVLAKNHLISSKLTFVTITILDLEGCKGLQTKHLMFLPQCTDLKFLSLRNTELTEVPKEIGELKKLETLDIRQTGIKKVPEIILALTGLKHLLAGCINKPESPSDLEESTGWIEVPEHMEQMSSIQTLAYVDATSSLLECLRELTQLKKLGIVISDPKVNSKSLCISLMMLFASLLSLSILDESGNNHSLGFLEYLCFPPLNLKSLTLKGYLDRLPQWIGDHKCLTKLTIANTRLRGDAIRLIGKIPTLRCLKLYEASFLEEFLTLKEKEFPVLRTLIIHCDYIEKVIFQKGTTPRLEVIRLVLSRSVTKRIEGITYLEILKEVSLIGDVDMNIQNEIKNAVEVHPKYKNHTLVFEKIEKLKTPNGGEKHDAPNVERRPRATVMEPRPRATVMEQQHEATEVGRRPEAIEGGAGPEATEGASRPADTPNGAVTQCSQG